MVVRDRLDQCDQHLLALSNVPEDRLEVRQGEVWLGE
jgi:hypothetical protein